jgi:hypothetical protein
VSMLMVQTNKILHLLHKQYLLQHFRNFHTNTMHDLQMLNFITPSISSSFYKTYFSMNQTLTSTHQYLSHTFCPIEQFPYESSYLLLGSCGKNDRNLPNVSGYEMRTYEKRVIALKI